MANPRTKKPPVPTEEERAAMQKLFYDSCLMGAHGMIVCNVQEYLADLLDTIGRPDLAAISRDLSQLHSS